MNHYVETLARVHNRGRPPTSFLDELVAWGRSADQRIFERNDKLDIYASLGEMFGPWQGDLHRRAVMLEALRVLAGFESSWTWTAERDITNPNSDTPCTEEAGIFQCSGNSMSLDPSLKALLNATAGSVSCVEFIEASKKDHRFAIEYCARLLRFTTTHHGPIKRKEIHDWVRPEAIREFASMLEGHVP